MIVPRYRYLVVLTFAGLNSSPSSVAGHQPPSQKRRRSCFHVIPGCLRRIYRTTRIHV